MPCATGTGQGAPRFAGEAAWSPTIPIPRPREVVQPVRNAGYALNDVKEIIARKNKQEEKAGNQV